MWRLTRTRGQAGIAPRCGGELVGTRPCSWRACGECRSGEGSCTACGKRSERIFRWEKMGCQAKMQLYPQKKTVNY